MNGALPDLSPLDLETDPKGCCARLYESDAVRWLLDDQLHPGGERLTLRLAQLAGVASGARVVDVACGSGATALLLARQLGCEAVGVDLGARAIAQARRAAGAGERVSFLIGDAEALPLPDAGFDVALSECSLCTFPDKPRAIAEMARVVRAGGTHRDRRRHRRPRRTPRRAAHRGRAASRASPTPAAPKSTSRCCATPAASRSRSNRTTPSCAPWPTASRRACASLACSPRPANSASASARPPTLARMAIEAIARGSLGYALITARHLGVESPVTPALSAGAAAAEVPSKTHAAPLGTERLVLAERDPGAGPTVTAQSSGCRQRKSGKRAKSRSKLTHSQPCSIASAAC